MEILQTFSKQYPFVPLMYNFSFWTEILIYQMNISQNVNVHISIRSIHKSSFRTHKHVYQQEQVTIMAS